jgi:hypothetical protein
MTCRNDPESAAESRGASLIAANRPVGWTGNVKIEPARPLPPGAWIDPESGRAYQGVSERPTLQDLAPIELPAEPLEGSDFEEFLRLQVEAICRATAFR